MSSPHFTTLATDRDPNRASLLHDQHPNIQPSIAKIWTELAYEQVRLNVAADSPSRLKSLYACPDPIEAFCFLDHSDAAHRIWRGTTHDGANWAVVDMSHFLVDQMPDHATAEDFSKAWESASDRALSYWTPNETSITEAEILVQGGITLKERVSLRDVLASQGILGPTSAAC